MCTLAHTGWRKQRTSSQFAYTQPSRTDAHQNVRWLCWKWCCCCSIFFCYYAIMVCDFGAALVHCAHDDRGSSSRFVSEWYFFDIQRNFWIVFKKIELHFWNRNVGPTLLAAVRHNISIHCYLRGFYLKSIEFTIAKSFWFNETHLTKIFRSVYFLIVWIGAQWMNGDMPWIGDTTTHQKQKIRNDLIK